MQFCYIYLDIKISVLIFSITLGLSFNNRTKIKTFQSVSSMFYGEKYFQTPERSL